MINMAVGGQIFIQIKSDQSCTNIQDYPKPSFRQDHSLWSISLAVEKIKGLKMKKGIIISIDKKQFNTSFMKFDEKY
jgi:hypothetical protein